MFVFVWAVTDKNPAARQTPRTTKKAAKRPENIAEKRLL
jgi:hypothetical protein